MSGSSTREDILREITFCENRLHTLGGGGDCSDDRALARTYRALIGRRREILARMAGADAEAV